MTKFLTLLSILILVSGSVFAATTDFSGELEVRHYSESNADHDKSSKTTGNHKKNYFRTQADFNLAVKANDELNGVLKMRMRDTTSGDYYQKWGLATDTAENGQAIYVNEAWFNYSPSEGLNFKIGQQALNYGNGHLIANNTNSGSLEAQNAMVLSYDIPELVKIDFIYQVNDDDEVTGDYVGDKQVPADKFYGVWFNTAMVPFFGDFNLVYATKYTGDSTATDKNKIDNTLSTAGFYAAGELPIGTMNLDYSLEYYKNMGKDKTGATEAKHNGYMYGAYVKLTLPEIYKLKVGLDYYTLSGDKDTVSDNKHYQRVHNGSWYYDEFSGMYDTITATTFGGVATAAAAGRNVIRAHVSLEPIETFTIKLDYVQAQAAVKDQMPQAKKGLFQLYTLGLGYKFAEKLKTAFYVGQQKLHKDNFPNNKDGNIKTKLVMEYKF